MSTFFVLFCYVSISPLPAEAVVEDVKVLLGQSCLMHCSPMDCSPQALLSKGSLGKSTGVGCYSLSLGIFPAQGLNLSLLHCRQILCHLSHRGRPMLHFVNRQYWRDAARSRKHLTSISQLSFLFAEYRDQWIGVWMAQSHLSSSDWLAPALHSSPILPTWQPVSQQLQLHPQAKGQLLTPTPSGYAGPLLCTSPGPWLMVSG